MSVSQHRTTEGLQRPRRSKEGPGTSALVREPKDFLSAHVTHWWVLNSTELLLNYSGSLPAAADFVIVVTVRHHAETARNGRLTYVSTLVNGGQQKNRALPAGVGDAVTQALNGRALPTDAAHRLALCESDSLPALCRAAAELRDRGKGRIVTFSPKVFIPLTRLCRDFCGYCTFRQSPLESKSLFMTIEEVVAVAKAGKQAGCTEALFTLGERPEQRYPEAKAWLRAAGYRTTLDYARDAGGCR